MKTILLVLVFGAVSVICFAQINLSDTFRLSLSSEISDSLKIDNLNYKIFKYSTKLPIEILPYADSAISLSLKINDSIRLANSYNRKGLLYYYIGDYQKALSCYFKALEIKEKIGETALIYREYNNIGLVLKNQKIYDESLRYLGLSLNLLPPNELKAKAIIINNMGICYKGKKEYELAKTYISKALALNQAIGEQQSLAHNYNNLGNIFLLNKEFDSAHVYLTKSLTINQSLFNSFEENQNLNNLALVHIQQNQFNEAFKYLELSYKLVQDLKSDNLLSDYYFSMQEYYNKKEEFAQAYHYMDLYVELLNKIFQNSKANQFEQLKMLADAEKELQKVEFLKHINKMQLEQIRTQRQVQIYGGAILLIVLLLLVILWRNFKTITALNKNLSSKSTLLIELNEELSTKNEELKAEHNNLEIALETVQKTQQQLFHSEKMASLGLLAAGVAHEINNPLNFIQGGAYCIQTYLHEQMPEHYTNLEPYVASINEGVQRASNIVSSLSNYSKQDYSIRTDSDVHSVIDNCLVMLQNDTKFRIEIFKNYDQQPKTIQINEGELHQAILNILHNSVQAIDGKGSIIITTRFTDVASISIDDTGCGIAPENLSKLFDPFYTTKDPGKGTGLGLSITYNLINKYNGKIEVRSQLGTGTTFIITFPYKNTE